MLDGPYRRERSHGVTLTVYGTRAPWFVRLWRFLVRRP